MPGSSLRHAGGIREMPGLCMRNARWQGDSALWAARPALRDSGAPDGEGLFGVDKGAFPGW